MSNVCELKEVESVHEFSLCHNKMEVCGKPPLLCFTNPNMQICVKKVPFVNNPDTISMGLGHVEEKGTCVCTARQRQTDFQTVKNDYSCVPNRL